MGMELEDKLTRFLESSSSDPMHEVATQLLELIENDAVEPLGPGRFLPAEEAADRLEQRMERILRRADERIDGLELIEDAVAHLRARESDMVAPLTFEDSDGVRWFVLAGRDDIVACYTSRPFIEADV